MDCAKKEVIRIEAEPTAATLSRSHTALMVIDMQRDFLEPGGFGESLGNDVSVLRKAIAPCRELLLCLLYTSPSPRDGLLSRMPSSA